MLRRIGPDNSPRVRLGRLRSNLNLGSDQTVEAGLVLYLKILVVHPRMSIMGGGERVVIHSILAASKAGHDVSLLSEEFDKRAFEDFFACFGLFKKVTLVPFPRFMPNLGRRFLLYDRLYYYQRQFRKSIPGSEKFELVLGTQDVGYVPSISVPTVQYCYFPEYFEHLRTSPSSPLWRLYYRPARFYYRNRVRRVDGLLSVSDFTRVFVWKIWGRDSETLYPPCPIELYVGRTSRREDLVISVGRIVREKRIHLFIEIARKLPTVKFIVIGSVADENSDYYRWLESRSPENVSFVLAPLRKVKDILTRAKVYVHSAENEHFGITIVEAMAAGCVPVVHDSGGPREIVSEDVGYRWSKVDEAAKQIAQILGDDVLRETLSKAAASRAMLFSPEHFEKRIESLFSRYQNQRHTLLPQ